MAMEDTMGKYGRKNNIPQAYYYSMLWIERGMSNQPVT